MVISCLETLLSDWNRYRLDEEGVNRRTIHVNTDGVSATDFGIDAGTRDRLFTSGQQAAQRFLDRLPTGQPSPG
jgi:NTE family protein